MTLVEHPRNSGRIYTCAPYQGGMKMVHVTAKPGAKRFEAIAGHEAAIRWLCDRSLRKSKAKQLVATALGDL